MSSKVEPQKKEDGCVTSCLSKIVLFLWMFLFGLFGGVWFGFNVARMYPEVTIPPALQLSRLADLSIPVFTNPYQMITTSNGIQVQVTDIKRLGEEVEVSFTVKNTGSQMACISAYDFSMRDGQSKEYSITWDWRFDDKWCDNPGFSGTFSIRNHIPPQTKGVKLYYIGGGGTILMASIP